MMKKIIMTNFNCDNCGDCVKACMEKNKVGRIAIMEKDGKYIPILCQQCASATCKEVCPVSAIEHKDGYVYLNEEICIGCGLCALACPFGAIRIDGIAIKCNGCYKRDVEICKEVCPTGAINNLEEILSNKLTTTLDKFSKLYAMYGRG